MLRAWAAVLVLASLPAHAQEDVIDVVVTGEDPTETERDRTPAVYVMRRSALDPPGRTLADALASVPGVEVRRSGGSADLATASLRGATSAQSPVYLAGIRLNDELTGTADLSTLPTWMLHRIEIYRGHAPIGVDELGMGGAVLLEPRTREGGRAGIGIGSFGEREARAALSLGGALAGIRYAEGQGDYAFLDDRGTRFDTADDIERTRENGDHREIDAWAISTLASRQSRLVTLVNAFAREAGAPGLQLPGARASRVAQQRLLAGVSGELGCGKLGWGARCTIDLGTDALLSRYTLRDPLRELGGAELTRTQGGRIGQRLGVRFPIVEWLDLGLRGSVRASQIAVDRVRAERYLVRSEIDAIASFLERVELALITALECHTTSGGETCGELEPVGRLGGRVRIIEPLSVIANVGRYVRVPTLGELHGISATVQGNPNLETETGWSLDAGVAARWRHEAITTYAQLVGFARFADSLIAYRRSSLGAVRPYNASSARVLGLELAAGFFWRVLRLGVALTATDPRDVSEERSIENDLLPYESRLIVAPEVELISPPWRAIHLDRASLAARFRYRSERVADPAGLIVLSAEHQLDLDGALMFVEHLGLRGRIANLLDQRTFDLVGYPLPGRSYHALLEAWW
jgi:iron complex outermembrane receptor protein